MVLWALSGAPFEPLHKASLHCLAIKTVFLVAIASGHRISTLHALSIEPGHIRWEPAGVRLVPRPGFIAKISLRLLSRLRFSCLLCRPSLPLKLTRFSAQSEP